MEPQDIEPERIARAEDLWVRLAFGLVAVFILGAIFISLSYANLIPQAHQHASPQELLARGEFEHPRVEQNADGSYSVYLLAKTWQWEPDPIVVPPKVRVTFYATSADVLHSIQIQHTNVNFTATPNQVAQIEYTFTTPGVYYLVCNEYCGVGHENMIGRVIVQAP